MFLAEFSKVQGSNYHFQPLYVQLYMAENHVTLKQQQWRIPLKNPIISGKTFFDISINTGQIGMGFKADTPKK